MSLDIHSLAELDAQISSAGSNRYVLVNFHATWCAPCKQVAPLINQLANKYADKLILLAIDVDECPDLTKKYEVTSMPTFVLFKKGKEVVRHSGSKASAVEKFFSKNVK